MTLQPGMGHSFCFSLILSSFPLVLIQVALDDFGLRRITLEAGDLFHEALIGPVDLVACKVWHFIHLFPEIEKGPGISSWPSQIFFIYFSLPRLFFVTTQVRILSVGGGIPKNTSRRDGRFLAL